MKKTKRWLSFIPSTLLLFAVTSCVLAQGTYTGLKQQTNGVSLAAGQNNGEFVYEINTQNSAQIFSKLSFTFTNSRIEYRYGKYNLKLVASVSKNADFSESVSVEKTVAIGPASATYQITFDEKADQLANLGVANLLKQSAPFQAA